MKTQKKQHAAGDGRRDFLRLATVGALSTGVAAVVTTREAEASTVRQDGSRGYQETDHVKKSYELARF